MIPIPGIFRAIDFDRHRRALGALAQGLEIVRDRLGSDALPAELADALARYCDALMNAIVHLERICYRLAGRKHEPRSYVEQDYKAHIREYEKAVIEYRSKGEHVNRAFRAPLS